MSGADRQFYVVSYDIANAKRLRRVARAMEGVGERIQRSIFHCRLTDGDRHALQSKLLTLIDVRADTVRIYPLCRKDQADIKVVGKSLPAQALDIAYFIV